MSFNNQLSEFEAKRIMVDVGYKCWIKGWVAANDGNISYRLNDREVLCTPTGVSKGMLTIEHICKIDLEGNVISKGKYRPSSEMKMHLRVMRDRPDVRSVLHAHPPYATAHAIAGIPLAECVIPEIIVGLGSIPIAPYGTPSTDEIPERLAPLLKDYNAWLLENHGALSAGEDIYQAYFRMESVELFAKMMSIARGLGNVNKLESRNVSALVDLRKKFGIKDMDNVTCLSGGTSGSSDNTTLACNRCNTQSTGGEQDNELINEIVKRVKKAIADG